MTIYNLHAIGGQDIKYGWVEDLSDSGISGEQPLGREVFVLR